MLAVFANAIANPPHELTLPFKSRENLKTREQLAADFASDHPNSTCFNFSNGDFMSYEYTSSPNSIVVLDDIFCIFNGYLHNICHIRRSYGLSRQATEAMVVVEAYKVLRDRAPYPADQVIKELDGKFALVLFDLRSRNLVIARDRDGSVQLHWGVAGDGCLVCSDDQKIVREGCGNRYTPFPPGCLFKSEEGLISFDHPLNKVRGMVREDDDGYASAVIFQVDLFTRLHSIPRSGSDSNWAGMTVVEGGGDGDGDY